MSSADFFTQADDNGDGLLSKEELFGMKGNHQNEKKAKMQHEISLGFEYLHV